jgi:Tfp pilus assembly protein PilX
MSRCCLNKDSDFHCQSGMTLVITLLLMLTLTLMASAITFVVNSHSDLTSSVTQKPLAMDSADTCVDQAVEWMQTAGGRTWLDATDVVGATAENDFYGIGSDQDLAAPGGPLFASKSLSADTARVGDTRADKFIARIQQARCTSVQMTVVKKTTATAGETGVGTEAGTDALYDSVGESSSSTYTILIVSEGIFNVATSADGSIDQSQWTQNSSNARIEVVLTYQL